MPGLGFLKLQKNPLRSIPTGVIFISSPRVNPILTKRVTFFRRQGSICTDFSNLVEREEFNLGILPLNLFEEVIYVLSEEFLLIRLFEQSAEG